MMFPETSPSLGTTPALEKISFLCINILQKGFLGGSQKAFFVLHCPAPSPAEGFSPSPRNLSGLAAHQAVARRLPTSIPSARARYKILHRLVGRDRQGAARQRGSGPPPKRQAAHDPVAEARGYACTIPRSIPRPSSSTVSPRREATPGR